MERRHSWTSTIDGVDHQIEVIYHALTGWMEIEVDGVRQARGWREWQTVVGGANLSCTIGSHRVDARVTQPFGAQDYSFALRIDGELQAGSDPQPEASELKRQTIRAGAALFFTIFVVTAALSIYRALN